MYVVGSNNGRREKRIPKIAFTWMDYHYMISFTRDIYFRLHIQAKYSTNRDNTGKNNA